MGKFLVKKNSEITWHNVFFLAALHGLRNAEDNLVGDNEIT